MRTEHFTQAAERIARAEHAGQFRNDGVTPYITHVEGVAKNFDPARMPFENATAWLHDVLEDTTVTEQELRDAGIPEDVIHAVKLLTKHPGQDYFKYLDGVRTNNISRRVKIADINYNLADTPSQKQIIKYPKALKYLQ